MLWVDYDIAHTFSEHVRSFALRVSDDVIRLIEIHSLRQRKTVLETIIFVVHVQLGGRGRVISLPQKTSLTTRLESLSPALNGVGFVPSFFYKFRLDSHTRRNCGSGPSPGISKSSYCSRDIEFFKCRWKISLDFSRPAFPSLF